MAKGDKAGGGGQATKERAQAAVGPAEGGLSALSEAEVEVDPYDEAGVLARIKELFGSDATLQDMASLVGAPDNAKVYIHDAGHGSLAISIEGGGLVAYRKVRRVGGKLVMENELFEADVSGGGLGIRVFGKQVKHAVRLGVSRIETTAARGPTYNGYYTWARFGYEAPLSPGYRQMLPPSLKGATKMTELMKTEAGAKWWLKHGDTLHMEFDLTPGSTSRKAHDKYLKYKGLR